MCTTRLALLTEYVTYAESCVDVSHQSVPMDDLAIQKMLASLSPVTGIWAWESKGYRPSSTTTGEN